MKANNTVCKHTLLQHVELYTCTLAVKPHYSTEHWTHITAQARSGSQGIKSPCSSAALTQTHSHTHTHTPGCKHTLQPATVTSPHTICPPKAGLWNPSGSNRSTSTELPDAREPASWQWPVSANNTTHSQGRALETLHWCWLLVRTKMCINNSYKEDNAVWMAPYSALIWKWPCFL